MDETLGFEIAGLTSKKSAKPVKISAPSIAFLSNAASLKYRTYLTSNGS